MITYTRALLLTSTFIGCTMTAMDPKVLPQEETPLNSEAVLQELDGRTKIDPSTLGGLPANLWKLILTATNHHESMPKLFSSLATLRLINPAFNSITHHEPFLEGLFNDLNHDTIPQEETEKLPFPHKANSLGRKYLSSYCASLLSKTMHTKTELQFLKRIKSQTWTWSELFDCVITPDISKKILSKNIPLLQFATVCMNLSSKTVEEKAKWHMLLVDIATSLPNSEPIRLLLQDLNTACGITSSIIDQDSPLLSSELSYESLLQAIVQQRLLTNSWAPLLEYPVDTLHTLLTTFMLSNDQREVLMACFTGDLAKVKVFLPTQNADQQDLSGSEEPTHMAPRKRQGASPVLLDLMLLIALKAKHKDIALHIMSSNFIKERELASINNSRFFCTWMFCEALKQTDNDVCSSLVRYIFSSFPQQLLMNPAVPIGCFLLGIIDLISSPEELDAWCSLFAEGFKTLGLPSPKGQALVRGCFLEETQAISTALEQIDDSGWLVCFSSLNIIIRKNSVKMLNEFLKNESVKNLIKEMKSQLIAVAQRENHPEIEELLLAL